MHCAKTFDMKLVKVSVTVCTCEVMKATKTKLKPYLDGKCIWGQELIALFIDGILILLLSKSTTLKKIHVLFSMISLDL